MFSFCFNVFIHSLTMSQSVAAPASALASNVLALIQHCCVCCVYQVICFADTCNTIDVYWCDYYCFFNKSCWLVSSMHNAGEFLMSRRFSSTSTLLPTAFCTSIITPTTRLWPKVTATAMLHFMMQHRWPSSMSFKLIKLPL